MPISVTRDAILALDLSSVRDALTPHGEAGRPVAPEPVTFDLQFPRSPDDPRELSEVPEVRLWFIRLDATYPWLPLYLDWGQELPRYVAMLVPHQFSPREGIQFNPEALDIWVMHRVFTLDGWMTAQGQVGRPKLQQMAKVLGYDLEDSLFELLGSGI